MRRVRGDGIGFPGNGAPDADSEAPRRVDGRRSAKRLLKQRGLMWEPRINRFMPTLVLGTVMIAAAALLLHVTRDQSLFADEWAFFAYRSQGSADALFAPNNGSLVLVPILIYRAIFEAFGPDIAVLRLILVALELLCAGLFFAVARRHIGDWIALGGATLLLFLGAGSFLVATIGITLYLAVALGLAAMIAIERGDLVGDLAACLLLSLALASYSVALPFVAGALIAVAMRPTRLRWWRAWVVALPLLLYAAWRVWAGRYAQHPKLPLVFETVIPLGAIAGAPRFVGEAFATSVASATGLFRVGREPPFYVNPAAGVPLAAVCVVAAFARLLWPRRPALDRSVWVFLPMPLVYWTALSLPSSQVPSTKLRAPRFPNNSAYVYVGVLLLLLAAAALGSGVRIPRPARTALGVLLLVALVPNLLALRQAAWAFRVNGRIDRAELAAVELAGSRAARVVVDSPQAKAQAIFVGFADLQLLPQAYLAAARRFGSAATPASALASTTPEARRAADLTLLRLFAVAPRLNAAVASRAPTGATPTLESGAAYLEQARRGCVRVRPRLVGARLSFRLPRGGFTLQAAKGASVALYLRRFADTPGLPTGSVAGGTKTIVTIPADASAQPWRLMIVPAQSVWVCALPNAVP